MRVNQQPGYVHFVHSAHVGAGIACATCHGNVGSMYVVYQPIEMNMGWCITCHRQYEKKFQPTSGVGGLLHLPLLEHDLEDT